MFGIILQHHFLETASPFLSKRFAKPLFAKCLLLSVLHSRSALLPWSSLHPSWLADILEDAPASWRGWALSILPSTLREPLEGAGPVADDASNDASNDASDTEEGPPPWWPAWFTTHVKRRLGYPDLPPWPVAAELPGSLWESDERTITRLVALWGTRGFISALRALPKEEAQHWIWSLPPACRPVADQTVKERRWSEESAGDGTGVRGCCDWLVVGRHS